MLKFLSYVWQLPQSIVAWVMMPFLGERRLIRTEGYTKVYEYSKMSGGISLGNYIFLSRWQSTKETSILHELGHSVDSRRFGWLYLLIIGLPSILNAIFNFTECYYDFYTERWANNNVGLETDENCNLRIKGK